MAKEIPLKLIPQPGSVSKQNYELFLKSLSEVLSKSGLPINKYRLKLPHNLEDVIFLEIDRDDSLLPIDIKKNHQSYLFYADLVSIIGQVAEWYYQHVENDKAKHALAKIFEYVKDESLLENLVSYSELQAYKDTKVAQKFYPRVVDIINILFIASAYETNENVIEKFATSGYVSETLPEKLPDLIASIEQQPQEQQGVATPDNESDISPGMATAVAAQAPPPPKPTPPSAINELSLEEFSKISAEVNWISGPIFYALFTHHGIPLEALSNYPELRTELYEHIRNTYINSRSKSRSLVFNQARTAIPASYLAKLSSFYKDFAQNLDADAAATFMRSTNRMVGELRANLPFPESTSELLKRDLQELIGSDSPGDFLSVKAAVESIVITYGISVELGTLGADGNPQLQFLSGQKHDAAWLITTAPDAYVQLIFGIPASVSLSAEQIRRLRVLLVDYARIHTKELIVATESPELSQGMTVLTTEERKKLEEGDEESYQKQIRAISTTAQLISSNNLGYNRNDGAEIVARSLTKNVKDQFKRQYLLWNSPELDIHKKKLIYDYLNIEYDDYTDFNQPSEEILLKLRFFKLTELQIKAEELEDSREKAIAQLALQNEEMIAFAQEMIKITQEERLRVEYATSFLQELTSAEKQKLAQKLNTSVDELHTLNLVLLTNNATQLNEQSAVTHDNLDQGDASITENQPSYNPRPTMAARRKRSRAFNSFTKRAANYFEKASMAGGPWAKAAALAAKFATDEEYRKKVLRAVGAGAGAIGLLIAAIAKLISSGKTALFSAIAGGAGGVTIAILTSAGPIGWVLLVAGGIVGGGIIGWSAQKAGLGIENTNLSNPLKTAPNLSPTEKTPPTSEVVPAEKAAAGSFSTASTILTTLPIGVAAPLGAMLLFAAASFYVIFIIMSAFLSATPTGLDGTISDGFSDFEGCWPTTGAIYAYRYYQEPLSSGQTTHMVWQGSMLGYQGPGIAIDISTGANSEADGINPEIYSPYAGTANFYLDGLNNDGYGNYVVVDTGSFALIFAHLLEFSPEICMQTSGFSDDLARLNCENSRKNVQIQAGQYIGRVNDTGNSDGNHLHYEAIGADILDLVPLTPEQKQEIRADESVFYNMQVSPENCAKSGGPGGAPNPETPITGYVAMGDPTADNIVTTTASQVSSPQYTCDWHAAQGLAASVNGNFYNTPTQPIGLGGSNPATYFANAANRGGPEYMVNNMSAFVSLSSGVQIIPIAESWANASVLPMSVPVYDDAVTGLGRYTSDDGDTRRKTAVGMGVSNGNCGTAGKQAVFLVVIEAGQWSQIRALLQHCGATNYVFLDAGGSSGFCSSEYSFPGGRPMPINIGLKSAEVTKLTITTSGVLEE